MDARTRDQMRLLEPYSEGDTLELTCETFGGDPRPRLTWYLENTVIDDSYEEHPDGTTINNLTFPSVGRQHLNARLVCQASNTNLTPSETKLLILDLNLRPLTVQILNKSRQLSADRSYEVECKTTGSRPDAQITWWKAGRQIKRSAKNYSENNSTVSVLTLVPEAEDHEHSLVCRAENSRVVDGVLEDKWKLNVHYVPIVTLKLGRSLNPDFIKEGDDVYFECKVKANPKSYRLTWYKGTNEIQHNASAGIILSDQSLVLQRVSKKASGDYSCLANNSEGSAASNPVSLQIRYAPLCKSTAESVHGAMKLESMQLHCEVDSSPPPTSFTWMFRNSGEQTQLPAKLYTIAGSTSTLQYTPASDTDFGAILCSASNAVGRQESPCLYKLVAAGHPMSLQNCSVLKHSADEMRVTCDYTHDGGLRQIFLMEVYELPSLVMRANMSSNDTPSFSVRGLETSTSYTLVLYAANAKGRSKPFTLYTVALRSPDKYTAAGARTALPFSPMLASLLAVAALLSAGVCAVITALYRRHARRIDRDKRLPNPGLYVDQSVDTLSKQEQANTYCGTPKLDYCNQYELKMEREVEDTDPDIIPCHYDKKSIGDTSKLTSPGAEIDASKVFIDRSFAFPTSTSSSNISVVNRGVCARSADITAAHHLASSNVRESCI